jgi:hypothetical protein
MNSNTELVDCPDCGQKFKLIESNPDGRGWETESFDCPRKGCNYKGYRKSSGSFDTEIPS